MKSRDSLGLSRIRTDWVKIALVLLFAALMAAGAAVHLFAHDHEHGAECRVCCMLSHCSGPEPPPQARTMHVRQPQEPTPGRRPAVPAAPAPSDIRSRAPPGS